MENQKGKVSSVLSFSIADMAGDRVKNRLLFPLTMLFVFGFVVFTILTSTYQSNVEPTELSVEVESSYEQTLESSSSATRETRMRLLDQDAQPLAGYTVRIGVDSIMGDRGTIGTNCDTVSLRNRELTKEAIRFKDLCRVTLLRDSTQSDDYGNVIFTNWTVQNGPAGIYSIFYYSDTVKTQIYKMFFKSTVKTIVAMNDPPLTKQEYGVPLTTQPKVKVLDSKGKPVRNKVVVAVSWPEPYATNYSGLNYKTQAEKYAYLENAISSETNFEGIATFTNLKVMASTSEVVYIVFMVDSSASCAWQEYAQSKLEINLEMPNYVGAIYMETGTHTVELITAPSSSVYEGEALEVQPKFRVLNTSGNPVSGVGCAAWIHTRDSMYYPRGYAIGQNASTDKILNGMIAADYYSTDMVNLDNQTLITVRKTDSDGYIQFSRLGFSKLGSLRADSVTYGLAFRCGSGKYNVTDPSVFVNVKTKVDSIKIVYVSTDTVKTTIESTYDLIITAKILDANKDGIQGKIISGIMMFGTTGTQTNQIIVREIKKTPSDENGIVSLYFKFTLVYDFTQAYLKFEFDGVYSPGTLINFSSQKEKPYCTALYLNTPPTLSKFTKAQNVTFKVEVLSLDGSSAKNVQTELDISSVSRYDFPIPSSVVPTDLPSLPLSDINGYIEVNFLFPRSFTGLYEVNLNVLNVSSEAANTVSWCKLSNPIKIAYVNEIEYADLVDTSWATDTPFERVIANESVSITYLLKDIDDVAVPNILVNISVDTYQVPPSYISFFLENDRGVSDFLTMNETSVTSNSTGHITFSFSVKKNYPGRWAIGFKVDNVHTEPITFTAMMTVTNIEIVQEPAISTSPFYTGTPLSTMPQVKISSLSPPLSGFVIVAIPVGETSEDEASVDPLSTSSTPLTARNAFTVIGLGKFALTNESGIATFQKLNVIDVYGDSACIRFRFAIGEPTNYLITSNTTSVYCFKNNFEVQLLSGYSTHIAPDQDFYSPISIRVRRANSSDLADGDMLVFSILPKTIGGTDIDVSMARNVSLNVLENSVCIIRCGKVLTDICSYEKVTVGGSSVQGVEKVAPQEIISGVENINIPSTVNSVATATLPTSNQDVAFEVTFNNLRWVIPSWHLRVSFTATTLIPRTNNVPTTQTITVRNMPRIIEITQHPPSKIKVGTEFVVTAKARLTDGSPLANTVMVVNVTKSDSDIVSSLLNQIMNLLGNSAGSVSSIADLVYYTSHVALEPKRCTAVTDSNGDANFYLMFTAGMTGNYTLRFETPMSSFSTSDTSEEFKLVNTISKVNFSSNFVNEITTEFNKSSSAYLQTTLTLPFNPEMMFIGEDNAYLDSYYPLKIVVQLVDYSEILSAADKLGIAAENINLATLASCSNFSDGSTAWEKIMKLWNTVTNAGQLVGSLYSISNQYYGSYSSAIFNHTSKYFIITNVSFKLNTPGTYMLNYIIDGFEAKQGIIQISDTESSESDAIREYFETIIAYFLIVVLIFINIPQLNKYFLLLGIVVIGAELFLVSVSSRGTYYIAFCCASLGALAILLVVMFVEECITQGYLNFHVMVTDSYMRYTQGLLTYKIVKIKDLEDAPEEKASKCEVVYQFFRLFIPFYYNRKKKDSDAFFYPQRFILSILCGIIAFIYVTIQLWIFAYDLFDQIEGLKNDISSAVYSFIRAAVSKSNSLLNNELSNDDLTPIYNLLDFFLEQLSYIQVALKASFTSAIVLGIVCYSISVGNLFSDFKEQALLMRRGKSTIQDGEEREASLIDAAGFPGLFIVNCVLGFLIFCIMFLLIFVIIYHPLFWKFLYENLYAILFIVIPLVINWILDEVTNATIYVNDVMYRYRLIGQIYEVYVFVTSLLSGIAVEIGRIFYAVLSLLVAIIRLNRPITPNWIHSMLALDEQYKSYQSLVGVYEYYNNPIANTFITILLNIHKNKSKIKGKELFRHLVQRRWLVAQGRKSIDPAFIEDKEPSQQYLRDAKSSDSMCSPVIPSSSR